MSGIPGAPRRRLELAIDRVLEGRYRILQPLGSGATSQVYLARDEALGRDVAIKVLEPAAARDADVRKRFVKEARALAQLSHPNITAVFDVGEVDGLPFIVMEKLEESLRMRIERDGALDIGDAIRIACEIAEGLAAAHARGIVHCDMKPGNVLFDSHGRAKIADFGIARTPQDVGDTPQLFATALYVAPERVEGRPPAPSCDIYGLGLVLYEMLVGRPPFTSSDPTVLLRDHVVRPPTPPSQLRTSLPREIDYVVGKALAKSPRLRYSRALDVARALRHIEGADDHLMTVRVSDTGSFVTEPLTTLLPMRTESPVVAFMALHALPIRRGFYSTLLVLPLFALLNVSGIPLPYIVLLAGLPAIVALAGHMSAGLAIAWVLEGLLLMQFVPVLAVLFLLAGLWLAVREYSPEQAIIALAAPASVPLGLAPMLVLGSTVLHGLAGVLAIAAGAVMAVVVALAQGLPTTGPYVVSGLLFDQHADLFSTQRALAFREAVADMIRPASTAQERFSPIATILDPRELWGQLQGLAGRFAGADTTSTVGTIAAWVVAAAMVWVVTRVFRIFIDAAFQPRRWFAVYLLAAALGTFIGAALLYGLFATWRPLAGMPDAPSDGVLFVSAMVGAILALASSVVIGSTHPREPVNEDLTASARQALAQN